LNPPRPIAMPAVSPAVTTMLSMAPPNWSATIWVSIVLVLCPIAVALESTPSVQPESLPPTVRGGSTRLSPSLSNVGTEVLPPEGLDLEARVQEIERGYIAQALERANGVQVKAADLLGMSFRSFRYYVKKYNLR